MAKKTQKVSDPFSDWNEYLYVEDTSDVQRLPTGIPTLDLAIGGGVPVGRVVELYGGESSGKSTIAIHLCKAAIDAGGLVHYIDAECATDDSRFAQIGINTNDPQTFRPWHFDYMDNWFEFIIDSAVLTRDWLNKQKREGAPIVYVVDSFASLPTKEEVDGNDSYGPQARCSSKYFRKMIKQIRAANAVVVCINQLRDNPGKLGFGEKTSTPGGRSLKFYASIRISVTSINKLNGKDLSPFGYKARADRVVGANTLIKVTKNKTADPHTQAIASVIFKQGYDTYLSLYYTLKHLKLLNTTGRESKIRGTNISFNKANVEAVLADNWDDVMAVLSDYYFADVAKGDVDYEDSEEDYDAEDDED